MRVSHVEGCRRHIFESRSGHAIQHELLLPLIVGRIGGADHRIADAGQAAHSRGVLIKETELSALTAVIAGDGGAGDGDQSSNWARSRIERQVTTGGGAGAGSAPAPAETCMPIKTRTKTMMVTSCPLRARGRTALSGIFGPVIRPISTCIISRRRIGI